MRKIASNSAPRREKEMLGRRHAPSAPPPAEVAKPREIERLGGPATQVHPADRTQQPELAKQKTFGVNPLGMSGSELISQIHSGEIGKVSGVYVAKVRNEIIEAMQELLETGARVRPLLADGKTVGYVRGLHWSERKWIRRFVMGNTEQILQALLLATTLSREQLLVCSSLEIQALSRIVAEMSDRDVSLYPYLSAFVSTSASEQLWYSHGSSLSDFSERRIILPNDKALKLVAPSDHSRLWTTLCTMREQSKRRLDDNFNSAMIVRSNVGKGANAIIADLRQMAKGLTPDQMEPWENIVRQESKSAEDGWAHAETSFEGLKREMDNMLANDRHERVIDHFHETQLKEWEGKQRKVDEVLSSKIPELEERGVHVLTERDVKSRQRRLRSGQPIQPAFQPAARPEEMEVDEANVHQRLKKYR